MEGCADNHKEGFPCRFTAYDYRSIRSYARVNIAYAKYGGNHSSDMRLPVGMEELLFTLAYHMESITGIYCPSIDIVLSAVSINP